MITNFLKTLSVRDFIAIFAANIFLFCFFTLNISERTVSDNDISRLAGIVSIVRYNELNIDKTPQVITGDKVYYDGKYYSSKPPVLNFVLGNLIKSLFSVKSSLKNNDVAIYRVSTFFTNIIPILGIFNLFFFLIHKTLLYKRLAFSFLMVFGTLILSYSKYLNNHLLLAFIQFLLFIILNFWNRIGNVKYILCGLLCSLLYVMDNTYGTVLIPVMIAYIFYLEKFSDSLEFRSYIFKILLLILGLLPFLIFHFYLSWVQFETLVPPQTKPEIYLSYPGSKWVGDKTGMEALNESIVTRFFNYSVGTYGFFLYSPILLFALFIRKNYRNALFVSTLIGLFGYLMFNAFLQPNYGGSAFGPRRFIPFIPILFFYVVKNFLDHQGNKLFYMLLILNIAIAFIGYTNPWNNWEYYSHFNFATKKELYFPLLFSMRQLFY